MHVLIGIALKSLLLAGLTLGLLQIMTAFVEYRPWARTAVTFSIDNVLSTHAARDRLLFRPNRAEPAAVFDEFRDRNRHRAYQITLKQSFGGGSTKVAAKGK